MANPLLSIVVPIYNSSETIEECVASLVSQTIDDLEILLIDDGSTDDSLEKCKKLASKDNRIRVFTKENAGQGIARNYGLDLATGEFIAFVDSDDTCTKAMYETLLSRARDSGSDVVVGGYYDLLNGAVVKSHPAGSMELRGKGEIDNTWRIWFPFHVTTTVRAVSLFGTLFTVDCWLKRMGFSFRQKEMSTQRI